MAAERGAEKRREILSYIINYIKQHRYAPSFREIGTAVGLRSTSSVQNHIITMINRGMLETDAKTGTPRAIRVPGWKFVKEEQR